MVLLLYAEVATYLDVPLHGETTISRVAASVSALEVPVSVLVCAPVRPSALPADWSFVELPAPTLDALTAAAADSAQAAHGLEPAVMLARLDGPFLSASVARAMMRRHARYAADVTLGEGFPAGIAPQILHGRILARLRELAAGMNDHVAGDLLFPVVQKDINAFDIEMELCRTDMRLLRVSATVDTAANTELCRRIAAAECRGTHEVLAWISANPPAHRTLPRYIQVQVLEQEVHRVAYSPYPLTRPEPTMPGSVMEARTFAELISRISRCSPEATVAVSVWGEIALHPDAEELIRAATKDNRLSLIVETSGVGWTAECAGSFIQDPPPRTSWIVGLDTADPEVYRQVRGEGFAEATEFAQKMLAAAPDSTYVQAVRAPQIDQTLQDFYKEWTARTENVIIQKYDWFCGRLPMSALGDNAPLRRPPCRHLQRDMVILLDGTVPLCREDLEVDVRLGNALEEELSTVWDRGAGHYNDHTRRRYSSLCKDCDEYYTFNA